MAYADSLAKFRANPTMSGLGQSWVEGSGETAVYWEDTPYARTGAYFDAGKVFQKNDANTYLVYEPASNDGEEGHSGAMITRTADVVNLSGDVIGTQQIQYERSNPGKSFAIGAMMMLAAFGAVAYGVAGASAATGATAVEGGGGVLGSAGSVIPEGVTGASTATAQSGFGAFATPAMDAAGIQGAVSYGGSYLAATPGIDAALGIGSVASAAGTGLSVGSIVNAVSSGLNTAKGVIGLASGLVSIAGAAGGGGSSGSAGGSVGGSAGSGGGTSGNAQTIVVPFPIDSAAAGSGIVGTQAPGATSVTTTAPGVNWLAIVAAALGVALMVKYG